MAKSASKSRKRAPSAKKKPARTGKKKLGGAKGPRTIDPLPGKPFEL